MKIYKKSSLAMADGAIVTVDGDVVMPAGNVVTQANALDLAVQKARYIQVQPKAAPMPTLDGFERKSSLGCEVHVEAKTPALDARCAKAEKIMEELDKAEKADQINSDLDKYIDLIRFASHSKVMCSDAPPVVLIDTPEIGNILDLTVGDVIRFIALTNGVVEYYDHIDEDADDEQEQG